MCSQNSIYSVQIARRYFHDKLGTATAAAAAAAATACFIRLPTLLRIICVNKSLAIKCVRESHKTGW